MEQEPSDELIGIQRHDLVPVAVGVITPEEGNLAVLKREDTVITDGNPVGISAEVLKNSLSVLERGLAVDDPFFAVETSQKLSE
jgi:hypothetical protein